MCVLEAATVFFIFFLFFLRDSGFPQIKKRQNSSIGYKIVAEIGEK